MFPYHSRPLSTYILTTFYLQDILTNVIYAHIYFFPPFLVLFIFPQSCHICFSSLPPLPLQLWPGCSRKKISLVTHEVICLSLNNGCECKRPASWNMFALCRWSRLFSSCPHAFFFFFANTCVSFSLKNIHYPLLHRCLFFFLTYENRV